MFKENKLSGAVKLALATTMAFSLQGCLVEGDTVSSLTNAEVGDNYVQVANPVGTVMGVVMDINRVPVPGATVSIGGRSVITGVGGTYQFTDIPVTDVVVNAYDTGVNTTTPVLANTAQALVLTIVPPAGYLGATVTVTAPAAVIDLGGDGDCSVPAGTTTASCETNIDTETFIDGFVAQAGTAVLPVLEGTVTGTARNTNTGEALADTTIAFSVTQGAVANNTIGAAGVNITYASGSVTATTAADGTFVLQNAPVGDLAAGGITLTPVVQGFTYLDHEVAGVATAGAFDTILVPDLGMVQFTPVVATLDVVAPFVTRVDTVTNGNPGLFNDDVDLTTTGTGIVVYFNEPVANSVDAATIENSVEIMVWNDTGAAAGDGVLDLDEAASAGYVTPSSITLSADRTNMTIIMPSNLTEGQSIHVNMLTVDFTDVAGNPLTTNAAATMTYDSALAGASTGNGNFIRLAISTFVEINKNAPAVTVNQLATDDTGVDLDPYPLSQNAVFADVNDADALISQLNATDDDGVGAADASTRLAALHNAMGGTGVVDGDQALVTFAQSTASAYAVTIADENGVNQLISAALTVTDNDGNLGGAGVVLGAPVVPTDANDIRLVLNGVEAGWTVTVVPTDDLGYFGTPNTLTLVDNVAPTTVLQTSYGVTTNNDFLVTGDTFGDGGELTNVGNVTGGTPYLNVTAQMLDNLSADGTATVLVANDDNSLAMELVANNTVDPLISFPYFTTAYDSGAYTAMAAAAGRNIGVAFSENVTAAATIPTNTGGTAVLSNWAVQNDTTQQDDGTGNNVDLMTADVDSVFTLAADDSIVVDFTDDVTDSAGNISVAAVNPKVVIRDALPPFITVASYNGDNMTITFNEEIVPANLDAFVFLDTLAPTTAVLSVYPANGDLSAENYTWNAGTNTLTIDKSAWGDNVLLAAGANEAFPLSAYAPSTVPHGRLSFNAISDVNGNNWAANGYGIPAIPFALESSINKTMTTTFTDGLDAAITSTIELTSTHRIDTTPITGVADDTNLTGAEVMGILTFTDVGVVNTIDVAATSAILTADGRTLTITLVADVAFDTGDDVSISVTSDWDTSQTVVNNDTL